MFQTLFVPLVLIKKENETAQRILLNDYICVDYDLYSSLRSQMISSRLEINNLCSIHIHVYKCTYNLYHCFIG